MKKKLDAFRGRLSPLQVAEGINAANSNAARLAEDAKTLLAAGRTPTAAAIAILSIEEAGKDSILRYIAFAKSDAEANEGWKDYRSHTRKNAAWLLPQLAAAGARRLDDLRPLFESDAEHPHLLDQLKQLGFYTDCLGKAHWSLPTEIISEGLAASLVQTAQLLSRGRQCTEQEIQLWVEHMGPVWNQDLAWMKQALVNWYKAMQAAGLMPEGHNAMEQFIRGGVLADDGPNGERG